MINLNKIITKPLSGFMELLPAEQLVFNSMVDTIRETYEKFGFVSMDNPVLERAEVLMAKAGGETEKQIYQFKKGDRDLAMRFDLTVPLARYVAENRGRLVFPFKRYAIGKVYRGERAQAGRFREFYQCDIDVIGDEKLDIAYDAEIPSIIYSIFKNLNIGDFTIRINNRKVLSGLFEGLGIKDKSVEVIQVIDKLEKVGEKEVRKEIEKMKFEPAVVDRIFDFLQIKGDSEKVISKLKKFEVSNLLFDEGVEELEILTDLIKKMGVPEESFEIDLTVARGLDYYTGTVYETRLNDYPEIGSVCSGGRYDDLAGTYISRQLPGVGISIGLTRLFDQLLKKGVLKVGSATPTKVLVVPTNKESFEYGFKIADKLRGAGVSTEFSLVEGKMKKKIGYADRLNIPYVVFVGEEEISEKVYTLKDMETGEQKKLNEKDLTNVLNCV